MNRTKWSQAPESGAWHHIHKMMATGMLTAVAILVTAGPAWADDIGTTTRDINCYVNSRSLLQTAVGNYNSGNSGDDYCARKITIFDPDDNEGEVTIVLAEPITIGAVAHSPITDYYDDAGGPNGMWLSGRDKDWTIIDGRGLGSRCAVRINTGRTGNAYNIIEKITILVTNEDYAFCDEEGESLPYTTSANDFRYDEDTEKYLLFYDGAVEVGAANVRFDVADPDRTIFQGGLHLIDTDGDGVANRDDNCDKISNPRQEDSNHNDIGNACEWKVATWVPPDTDDDDIPDGPEPDEGDGGADDECLVSDDNADCDGDGIINLEDNCPEAANGDQADGDEDGIGDVCEPDSDSDGVADDDDNCPAVSNPEQEDTDENGVGDACQTEPSESTAGGCGCVIPGAKNLGTRNPALPRSGAGKYMSPDSTMIPYLMLAIPIAVFCLRRRKSN